MDEDKLINKLRKVEALLAGATTLGEEQAAANARSALRQRLREAEQEDPASEWTFHMPDAWRAKLFCALLRRYDIRPYRYRRQRHTTVMARVPKRFLDQTLWPHYKELSKQLEAYLNSVTDRIIKTAIHSDASGTDIIDTKELTAANR